MDEKEAKKPAAEAVVNLELLKRETGLSIVELAAAAGLRESKTIYKWGYPKSKGGARPTYETIAALLRAGASVEAIFGEEFSGLGRTSPTVGDLAGSEEFKAGVREALAEILSEMSGFRDRR